MKKNILLLLLLSISNYSFAKVLLFTYAYNRPDFIEMQHRTFKKFLKDEYEFIVFNDARDKRLYAEIENMCKKYGIRCIQIPQEIHARPYLQRWPGEDYNAPAVRNCNVVQYSLNEVGFKHDDIVALLDSDLFLVRDFSIRDYLQGYDLAGAAQSRSGGINYLWIGIAFLDMATMPNKETINFNCGRIGKTPVDAGGQTHNYLKNNPDVRLKYFGQTNIYNLDTYDIDKKAEPLIKKFTSSDLFMVDNKLTFLHYRGGTNWDNQSSHFHNNKTRMLNDYINYVLGS